MGIKPFDLWAEQRCLRSMPLHCLKGSVIGIDAGYYLKRFLKPQKGEERRDPLLAAHGGDPYQLESAILKDLETLTAVDCKAHFVFDGLDYGIKDKPFEASMAAARTSAAAFEIYEQEKPGEAIEIFASSSYPTPRMLFEYLKKLLHAQNVEFSVAPYSALAQLVYYYTDPGHFVDAIYGPSELFLFGADKIITKFDIRDINGTPIASLSSMKQLPGISVERSGFAWLERKKCLEELGNPSLDLFIDACLMAGSDILITFPPLEKATYYPKGFSIRDVVTLVLSCSRMVSAVCSQYHDDPDVKRTDYYDSYLKALTTVRHHIVMNKEGNVETLNQIDAPSDVHDCIGQRLPEEIHMYLSRGLLRTRVFEWLTSGMIFLVAPSEGLGSFEYRNLVKTGLEPIRRTSLCLLADFVNRYYQRKEVVTRVWFDPEYEGRFNLKDLLPSQKSTLLKWHVNRDLIAEAKQDQLYMSSPTIVTLLSFAVRCVANTAFSAATLSAPGNTQLLRTVDEVTLNVIWRFLHLRQYVDDDHQLTQWGKVLQAALGGLGERRNPSQEQAVLLAIELLRFNLLTSDALFPDCSGAPCYGRDMDKQHSLMVARIACLGKLRHTDVGYSGPLSRHLLAYHNVAATVQEHLRDLMEMCLATMFIGGEVERDRSDWMEISLSLPLYNMNSCGLGNLVKTYLEQLHNREDPTALSTRAEMKEKSQGYFVHSGVAESLEDGFALWDAVFKGVISAGDLIREQKMFEEVDQWLSQRR